MKEPALASRTTKRIRYQVIQLADARFAVVPEHLIRMLCRRAGFGAVCVVAGDTQLTVMRSRPTSFARALLNAITLPLAAE